MEQRNRKTYALLLLLAALTIFALFGTAAVGITYAETANAAETGEMPYPVTVQVNGGAEIGCVGITEAFAEINQTETTSAELKLYADFTKDGINQITDGLVIKEGKAVTIDLNGHTLDRGLTEKQADGYVVKVTDANTVLTLTDTSEGKRGKVTGGYNENGGGIFVDKGKLILNGGSVCGNRGYSGGGIYINLNATVEMNDGSIAGNATFGDGDVAGNSYFEGMGGAVYAMGAFRMTGGTIENNTAELFGGVYVFLGNFELSGGTLANNTMTYSGAIINSKHFRSDFGNIVIGDANRNANVWVSGTFMVSGTPSLAVNNGAAVGVQNVQQIAAHSKELKVVDGGYTGEEPIGITFAYLDEYGDYYFRSMVKIHTADSVTIDKRKWNLTGAEDGKAFGIDKDGNVVLGQAVRVSYDTAGAEGTPQDGDYIPNEAFQVPDGEGLSKNGYTFTAWLYDNKIFRVGDWLTVPENDITLRAIWRNVNKTYDYAIANLSDGYVLTDGDDVLGFAGMGLDVLLYELNSDRASDGGSFAECGITFHNVDLGGATFVLSEGKYTISGTLTSAADGAALKLSSNSQVISTATIGNTLAADGVNKRSAVYVAANSSEIELLIRGGTLSSKEYALYMPGKAKIVLESGSIEGKYAVWLEKSSLTVNGGEVYGHYIAVATDLNGGAANNSSLIVNGGIVRADDDVFFGGVAVKGINFVTIVGGTVQATNQAVVTYETSGSNGWVKVSGGRIVSEKDCAFETSENTALTLSGNPVVEWEAAEHAAIKTVGRITDAGYAGKPLTLDRATKEKVQNRTGEIVIVPANGVTIDCGKWVLLSEIYSLASNAQNALVFEDVKFYNYIVESWNVNSVTGGGSDIHKEYGIRIYDLAPGGEKRQILEDYRFYAYSETDTMNPRETYYNGINVLEKIDKDRVTEGVYAGNDAKYSDCVVTFRMEKSADGLYNSFVNAQYGNYTICGDISSFDGDKLPENIFIVGKNASVTITAYGDKNSYVSGGTTAAIVNHGTLSLNRCDVRGSVAIINYGAQLMIADSGISATYAQAIVNEGGGIVGITNSTVKGSKNNSANEWVIDGGSAQITIENSTIDGRAYKDGIAKIGGILLGSGGALTMRNSNIFAIGYGIKGGAAVTLENGKFDILSGTAIAVDGIDLSVTGGSIIAEKAIVGAANLSLTNVTITASATTKDAVITASGTFTMDGGTLTAAKSGLTFANAFSLNNVSQFSVRSVSVTGNLTLESVTSSASFAVTDGVVDITDSYLDFLSLTNSSAAINNGVIGSISVENGSLTIESGSFNSSGDSEAAIQAAGTAKVTIKGGNFGGITVKDNATLAVFGDAALGKVSTAAGSVTANGFTGSGELYITDGRHDDTVVFGGALHEWTLGSAGFNLIESGGNLVLSRPQKYYNYVVEYYSGGGYMADVSVKDVNPNDENDFVWILKKSSVYGNVITCIDNDRMADASVPTFTDCTISIGGSTNNRLGTLNFAHGKYSVTVRLKGIDDFIRQFFVVNGEKTEVTLNEGSDLSVSGYDWADQKSALIYVSDGARLTINGGRYASNGKTIWVHGATLIVNYGTIEGVDNDRGFSIDNVKRSQAMAIYADESAPSEVVVNQTNGKETLIKGDANYWFFNYPYVEMAQGSDFWFEQNNPVIAIANGTLTINGGTIIGPSVYVGVGGGYIGYCLGSAHIPTYSASVTVNGGDIQTSLQIYNTKSNDSIFAGGRADKIEVDFNSDYGRNTSLTVSGGTIDRLNVNEADSVTVKDAPKIGTVNVYAGAYITDGGYSGTKTDVRLLERQSVSWNAGDVIVKGSANINIWSVVVSKNGAGGVKDGNIVAAQVYLVRFVIDIDTYTSVYYDTYVAPETAVSVPDGKLFGGFFMPKTGAVWYSDVRLSKVFDLSTTVTAEMLTDGQLTLYTADWLLAEPVISVHESTYSFEVRQNNDGTYVIEGDYTASGRDIYSNFTYEKANYNTIKDSKTFYKWNEQSRSWESFDTYKKYVVADSGKYKCVVTFVVGEGANAVTTESEIEFNIVINRITLTLNGSPDKEYTFNGKTQSVPYISVTGAISGDSPVREYSLDGKEWVKVTSVFELKNVGSYNVKYRIFGDNYTTLEGEINIVINPMPIAAISFFLRSYGPTYNGKDQWETWATASNVYAYLEYSLNYQTVRINFDISLDGGEFISAGEYTVRAALPEEHRKNFALDDSIELEKKVKIGTYSPNVSFDKNQKFTYNGAAQTPVAGDWTGINGETLKATVRTGKKNTSYPEESDYCDIVAGKGYVYVTFDAKTYPNYSHRTNCYEFNVLPAELTLHIGDITLELGETPQYVITSDGLADSDKDNTEMIRQLHNALQTFVQHQNGDSVNGVPVYELSVGIYRIGGNISTYGFSEDLKARYTLKWDKQYASLTIEESFVYDMALPQIAENLIYNGEELTCVVGGNGYTLSGHVNWNAGTYTAVATPKKEQNTWTDGTSGEKTITYTIAPMAITITVNGGLMSEKGSALISLLNAYLLIGEPVAADQFAVTLSTEADGATAGRYDVNVTWTCSNNNNYSVTVTGDKGAYLVYSLDDYYAFIENNDYMSAIEYVPETLTDTQLKTLGEMLTAYNAMDDANKGKFTEDQTNKIAVLSAKTAAINAAKAQAETALKEFNGFDTTFIAGKDQNYWVDVVKNARSLIKAFTDLSSGLNESDLDGTMNLETAEKLLAAYDEKYAEANTALAALKSKTAQGIANGDYTRTNVQELLDAAKTAAVEYVSAGGKNDWLNDYSEIARITSALDDYDNYKSFLSAFGDTITLDANAIALSDLKNIEAASAAYSALRDGATELLTQADKANIAALKHKADAIAAAKSEAENALAALNGITATGLRDKTLTVDEVRVAIETAEEKVKEFTELSSGVVRPDLAAYDNLAAAEKAVADYEKYTAFITNHNAILVKNPDELVYADVIAADAMNAAYRALETDVSSVLTDELKQAISALADKAKSLTEKKAAADEALGKLVDALENSADKATLETLKTEAEDKIAEYVAENGAVADLIGFNAIKNTEDKISEYEKTEINDKIREELGTLSEWTDDALGKLQIPELEEIIEKVQDTIDRIDAASEQTREELTDMREKLVSLKDRLNGKLTLEKAKEAAIGELKAERDKILASSTYSASAKREIADYYAAAIENVALSTAVSDISAHKETALSEMSSVKPIHIGWLVTDLVFAFLVFGEIAYLVLRKKLKDKRRGTKTFAIAPLGLLSAVHTGGFATGVVFFVLLLIAFVALGIWIADMILRDKGKKSPFVPVTNKVSALLGKYAAFAKKKASPTPKIETDETIIEVHPDVTSAALETESPDSIDEAEDIEQEEAEAAVIARDGKQVFVRYDFSFRAKLIQSPPEVLQRYGRIVDALQGVKSKISWRHERFYLGKKTVAILVFRGRTLCVALPLDPKNDTSKYHGLDLSEVKRYVKTPFLLKLTSERKVKYAGELITEILSANGVVCGNTEKSDFFLPFQSTEELIAKGLVKVLASEELTDGAKTVKADISELIREKISMSEAQNAMTDDVAARMIEDLSQSDMPANNESTLSKNKGKRGIINVDTLSAHFRSGDTVTLQALKEKKLMETSVKRYKVLARGSLHIPITVVADEFSLDAVKMIVLTGGKTIQSP